MLGTKTLLLALRQGFTQARRPSSTFYDKIKRVTMPQLSPSFERGSLMQWKGNSIWITLYGLVDILQTT